jgi:hypothetical protein
MLRTPNTELGTARGGRMAAKTKTKTRDAHLIRLIRVLVHLAV